MSRNLEILRETEFVQTYSKSFVFRDFSRFCFSGVFSLVLSLESIHFSVFVFELKKFFSELLFRTLNFCFCFIFRSKNWKSLDFFSTLVRKLEFNFEFVIKSEFCLKISRPRVFDVNLSQKLFFEVIRFDLNLTSGDFCPIFRSGL